MIPEQLRNKGLGPRVWVVSAEVLGDYRVLIAFDNDTTKSIDLEPFLSGPIFDPLRRDPALFQQFEVRGGTIAWANDADIDPDVLYYGLAPAWMEVGEGT